MKNGLFSNFVDILKTNHNHQYVLHIKDKKKSSHPTFASGIGFHVNLTEFLKNISYIKPNETFKCS